jgi:hypothetical protein
MLLTTYYFFVGDVAQGGLVCQGKTGGELPQIKCNPGGVADREKPSPSCEGFNKLAVWKITGSQVIHYVISSSILPASAGKKFT